jgi:hypothetical protein
MNTRTFDLTQTLLQLPDLRHNLLTPEKVETIESSPGLGRLGDLLLGKSCPSELAGKLAWQSEPGAGSIHWISLRLKNPTEMDSLVLVTLPKRSQDGNRHAVRDCDIELTDEKSRILRCLVRRNEDMHIVVRFKPCRVKAIKILLGGANLPPGDQIYNAFRMSLYSLMSIQAYRGQPIKTTENQISLKIPTGPGGSVCIFEGRELGGPVPGIAPGKIAESFLKLGYGVNLITAEHLCAVPRNKIPFTLFVNLSGKNFPANSWLYQALREKCHLLSVGGLPFSEPCVLINGTWRRLGFDLGLTATAPDWVQDHASRSPEQLRIDTTRHRTVNEARRISSLNGELEFTGRFSGHGILADLGEILSIEQDQKLAERGLWSPENVEARRRVSQYPLMYGVWGHDYNPIYQTPCARLAPLLEARDTNGFYQGIVAGAIINYAGRYEGSRWGVFEINDFSELEEEQKDDQHLWLAALGHRLVSGSWFSFIRTGRYGMFNNERCEIATHSTGSKCDIELVLKAGKRVLPLGCFKNGDETKTHTVNLHIPKDIPPGLVTVQGIITDHGRVVDVIETGVLIRTRKKEQVGPKLEYRNNLFSIDGKPEILLGSRTDGFHQWGQPEQEPLAWDKTLQQMRTMNLRIFSPVHVSYYEAGGKLSETLWDIIETQAALCQMHNIIFAPCLFFPRAMDYFRDRRSSSTLAREFARRLKTARGIYLYLYDDGLPQDIEMFNEWTGELRKVIQKERPGTLLTAEFVHHSVYHALIKGTSKNLDFLAISHHAMTQDVLPNLLVDSTLAGKATTNAEFGMYDPGNTTQAAFKYRFNLRLGIAQHQALLLNWMLQDTAHAQFPWGSWYAHDNFPKSTGRTYQAEALLVAGCRPMPPEEPIAAVFLPMNRMRFNMMQSAELSGGDYLLEEKLRMMLRAGIPYRIVNENDLARLGRKTRFLIIPRLTDPNEKTQQNLRNLAKKKIRILWQQDGFRPDPILMREMVAKKQAVGIEPGSPAEYTETIFEQIYGKKWTADLNRPYVLSRKFKEMTYTLITNLPKSTSSRNSREITLAGREFNYDFDEDHLGVLLHHNGRLWGAAGFQKLSMDHTLIAEGPGSFYLLAFENNCLLIIPQVPGRYRINGKFDSKKVLACPAEFEHGFLKTGIPIPVKPGKIREVIFLPGQTGPLWFVGSENQIKAGISILTKRLDIF